MALRRRTNLGRGQVCVVGTSPLGAADLCDIDALAAFVKADLGWQLALGADGLLLPGLKPEKNDDSGVRVMALAAEG